MAMYIVCKCGHLLAMHAGVEWVCESKKTPNHCQRFQGATPEVQAWFDEHVPLAWEGEIEPPSTRNGLEYVR